MNLKYLILPAVLLSLGGCVTTGHNRAHTPEARAAATCLAMQSVELAKKKGTSTVLGERAAKACRNERLAHLKSRNIPAAKLPEIRAKMERVDAHIAGIMIEVLRNPSAKK